MRPLTVAPKQLRALAGRYGAATVTLRGGALWLARPEREARRLVPLSANGLYGVEGLDNLRTQFRPGRLELLRQGEAAPRVLERS